MLGILQRYTLREIIGPSLLGFLVFTFLLLVRMIFDMMDLLINTEVSPLDVGELVACALPTLFPLTVPMAMLLGVLLGIGRMASDNEIIAIRTSGVHLWRIYWPIIALAGVLSASMMAMNLSLTPALALRMEDLELRIRYKLKNAIRPGRIYSDLIRTESDSRIAFSFGQWDESSDRMRNVTLDMSVNKAEDDPEAAQLYREDEDANNELGGKLDATVLITAPVGEMIPQEESASITMALYDGTLHFLQSPATDDTASSGAALGGLESLGGSPDLSQDKPIPYDIAHFRKMTHSGQLAIGDRDGEGRFVKHESMMRFGELVNAFRLLRIRNEADKFWFLADYRGRLDKALQEGWDQDAEAWREKMAEYEEAVKTAQVAPEFLERLQWETIEGKEYPTVESVKAIYDEKNPDLIGVYKDDKYMRRYKAEIAERLSMPLACVFVILLAIPLAIYIRPSAKTLGFAIALGLTFAYYILLKWGVQLTRSTSALSSIGVPMIFMPNIVLGGIGMILMRRTLRQ